MVSGRSWRNSPAAGTASPTSQSSPSRITRRSSRTGRTPDLQFLNGLWDEHVRDEFAVRDAEAPLATMVPEAYVNHVPVMTGGTGREQLREFSSRAFIPQMPPDTEIQPVSRTIGTDRLVD